MAIPPRLRNQAGRYALVDGIPFQLPVSSQQSPALMAVFPINAEKAKALMPGQHGEAQAAPAQTDVAGFRHWLPQVGPGWEQQRDLFARNSGALKTEFKLVPGAAAAGHTGGLWQIRFANYPP